MSGRRSREKGKRGELEVRDLFREHGFDVDRVPNSGGLRIKGDLHGLVPLHVEVKRRERLNVQQAYRQALDEAPAGREPMVAARMNESPWLGVIDLGYLLQLLECACALEEVGAIADEYPDVAAAPRLLELVEAADRLRQRS